ncbi:chloramphenicol phosphotransferase CPT family protein [Lysinibacillus sphaericus]
MSNKNKPGSIVILNGPPRSGKSSIAAAVQDTFDEIWMNVGVDTYMKMTPKHCQPGIGLRPGGERPDLEPLIITMYQAMYESIAAHSRLGLNVVVDVGHHDSYSTRRGILNECAGILKGLPVLFVGLTCPVDVIMERRMATWGSGYTEDGEVPGPVIAWQESVHVPGIYDVELDTSVLSSEECAAVIRERLEAEPYGEAFKQIADKGSVG